MDLAELGGYMDVLVAGVWMTLALTAVSFVLGATWGLVLALMRLSRIWWVHQPAKIYINVFLSTPVLIQLFFIWFALPLLTGVQLPAFEVIVLTLSLNAAASMAEIYRAGIAAVEPGQRDAASVLGLSWWQTMRWVVLAQAIRIVLPPLASAVISLVKDSSLATFIGLGELFNEGRSLAIKTFRPIEIFTLVAIIYFLMTYPISLFSAYLERRFSVAHT